MIKQVADFLSRDKIIDLLKTVIETQSKNSLGYSFAIDGKWGCGKTWLLNELEAQLAEDKECNYLIFHYNAWENDFYEEPLVAILSVMIEKLNEVIKQKSFYESAVEELLKEALNDLNILVCGIIKGVTKIDIEKSIQHKKGFFKRIKQNTKLSSKGINPLIPLQTTLKIVRDNITKLSDKYSVILVVDELDLCLPEYAIKVLERLHHICNTIPVIQILVINKRHLSDSIAKIFGKDYGSDVNKNDWNNQFAESYLQKFVDVIIPLPNGKLDNQLEILNGLEKEFKPYIRKDMEERDFINLDDEFLISFITALMNGIERRLQEKIFKQVELCHKLTIDSGIKYETERMSYAILIYEIISCICRYVFHSDSTCTISLKDKTCLLEFFDQSFSTLNPKESENKKINYNLRNFFIVSVSKCPNSNSLNNGAFKISDTKSYIMAYFLEKPKFTNTNFEKSVWNWIAEDKIFLHKYDEIMNMLTIS